MLLIRAAVPQKALAKVGIRSGTVTVQVLKGELNVAPKKFTYKLKSGERIKVSDPQRRPAVEGVDPTAATIFREIGERAQQELADRLR